MEELNPPQPSFNDGTADNSFFRRVYGQESAKWYRHMSKSIGRHKIDNEIIDN